MGATVPDAGTATTVTDGLTESVEACGPEWLENEKDIIGCELRIHPLARVRAARGWSYQQLARVIARQARQMGVPNMAAERQKTWRWEHKGVVPDQLSQRALAAVLEVPTEVVVAHPWPTWLPVDDDPAVLRTMEVSLLRKRLQLAVRALAEVEATGVEAVARIVGPVLVALTGGEGTVGLEGETE